MRLGVQLLLFGAQFQLVDCLQATALAALRAYHETASPPRYQMFAYWVVGLPLGIGLGFYSEHPWFGGPHGFWLAMVVSLLLAGLLMMRRLLQLLAQYRESAPSNSFN